MLASMEVTVEEIRRLITSDVLKKYVTGIESSASLEDLVGHSKVMFS
jgi:hypothetical protein